MKWIWELVQVKNKQQKRIPGTSRIRGGNVYASTVAERNVRNFAVVNSPLLLEKMTTDDVQNKISGLCPDSMRRAPVIIIYLHIL